MTKKAKEFKFDDDQKERVADLESSLRIAKLVFDTESPDMKMIFLVAEIVYGRDESEREEALDELKESVKIASRLESNSVATPTPDAVAAVWGFIFGVDIDENDEDDDEEIGEEQ